MRGRSPGAAPHAAWLCVLAIVATALAPAHAADPVQRVEVRLTIDGGDPHPLIIRRIVEAIDTAAQRLLIGRDSELVGRQEAALAGVLRDVVDRVVRGYRVQTIGFQAGVTTAVLVALEPRPPVLGELPVVTTLETIHPDAQPLVRAVLQPIVPELRGLPARLPVEALEWAGAIVDQKTAELVERAAAGFTATGRIEVTPIGRILVVVVPRDTRVIRDIGVRFRSTSIPYVLISSHGPQVLSMAEPLRGLPVAFATAHRAPLEAMLRERLAAYEPARQYGVVATPVLQVGEVTHLTVLAESTLYRGRVEARINFGAQAPPTDVRVQLGRAVGPVEPFLELTLIPSTLSLRWLIGVQLEFGDGTHLGFKTTVEGDTQEAYLTYRISPNFHVRGAYLIRAETLETTVGYRMNESFSWEVVATSRSQFWIRLVGNL